MSGFYYTHATYPAFGSQSNSTLDRAEWTKIQTGFDKLPTPTGNANKPVKVKNDESGLVESAGATVSDVGAWSFSYSIAVPTMADGNSSTNAASTAFAMTMYSPAFRGIPTAPTAAVGTNTTQLATTAFVVATSLTANLPGQTNNAGKFITTDGTNANWGGIVGRLYFLRG